MGSPRPPLILLPPSETKAVPVRGRPLDLERLSFPVLTSLREALLDADLRQAPTTTAGRLYTGVLYAALEIETLPARAASNLVIVSPQYGALRPSDRVPPYRRKMNASYWRDGLRAALDEVAVGRVIVDCRSATYVAAWRPAGAGARSWVQVSVVEERDGIRRVVSHMAKKTRGEVARHLLLSRERPRSPAELAELVARAFSCELAPPPRLGEPFRLTVVERSG